jgi:hypothetical protein
MGRYMLYSFIFLNLAYPANICIVLYFWIFVDVENSVLGGSLIITGLYAVTWASYRERQAAAGVISHHVSKWESLRKTSFPRINIFSGSSSSKPSDWRN